MRRTLKLLPLFTGALLLAPVGRAQACFQLSVCTSLQTDGLIFRGRVTEVTPVASQNLNVRQDMVSFAVDEVLQGQPGGQITLQAWRGMFAAGKEYVVYAERRDVKQADPPTIDGCARNHAVPSADDDGDLLALRAYVSAQGTGIVTGEIDLPEAMKDHPQVSIDLSNGQSTIARPNPQNDRELSYLLKGVAPGEYQVAASVPDGFAIAPSPSSIPAPADLTAIQVQGNSCREVYWHLRYDSHIRGQVVDSLGNPVAGVEVGLISNLYPDQIARGRYATSAHAKTDKDGRYDFVGLDPGDYVVVLHPHTATPQDPNPPVFYPAKESVADATVLRLQASASLNDIDFMRPDPLQPVTVHVEVTRKAGTPIDRAMIIASDAGSAIEVAATEHTDGTGRVDLNLLAGRKYRITASTPEATQNYVSNSDVAQIERTLEMAQGSSAVSTPLPPPPAPVITEQEQPVCAGPVEFIARDGMTLNLTPDKSFAECRSAPKPKVTQ